MNKIGETSNEYDYALSIEPKITDELIQIAAAIGGTLAGLDNRIKDYSSFKKKEHTYKSGVIHDIIRYTFLFDALNYTEQVQQALDVLKKHGQKVIKIKNTWNDELNPYKAINTFVEFHDGFMYEIQFHTPQSFNVKSGKMHDLYKYRKYLISEYAPLEQIEDIDKQMFKISYTLKIPPCVEEIDNYG
jgi:pyruvate/oxaloacetate carboxyltransferase